MFKEIFTKKFLNYVKLNYITLKQKKPLLNYNAELNLMFDNFCIVLLEEIYASRRGHLAEALLLRVSCPFPDTSFSP